MPPGACGPKGINEPGGVSLELPRIPVITSSPSFRPWTSSVETESLIPVTIN